MYKLLLLAAVGASACGPDASAVKRAHEARYDTSFEVVWNAVHDELRDRYDRLAVAGQDLRAGIVVSGWKKVDTDVEVSDPEGSSEAATLASVGAGDMRHAAVSQQATVAGSRREVVMRAKVRVRPASGSGPPWTVEVDSEAAVYRAGMTTLTPVPHGEDEPLFVRTHADKVALGIYQRLRPYAR